ncbi:MAG TPA: hypothetical protein VGO55_06310 [Allosphingosinicella sp.]|jgi:hypothetical protein|nr:hypothetical protein [Allosphingosinicella sp.]
MIDMIAAAALAAQAPAPVAATLGSIRMHLFYRGSGELSENIAPPAQFAGWNTLFSADDMVVVAELRTTGQQNIDRPLRIVARGRGNRVLAQRTFRSILTSDEGRAYLPLYLNDVACAGTIQVTVTFGRQSRAETLTLECGE